MVKASLLNISCVGRAMGLSLTSGIISSIWATYQSWYKNTKIILS